MTVFLKVFSFSFVVIAAIGLFNYMVDPYGIYNHSCITGVTCPKSEAQNYEKLVKAYLVYSIKPDAVAMGTSRTGFGIDPDSRAWVAHGRKFNLSLADGGMYVTRRFLEHASEIHAPKQVVLGLDFFVFNAGKSVANDYSEDYLSIDKHGVVNNNYLKHIFLSTVFSYGSIKNSIRTIMRSDDPVVQVINPRTGMRQFAVNGEVIDSDDLVAMDRGAWQYDTRAAFRRNEAYYARDKYFVGIDRSYFFEDENTGNSPLHDFREIVRLCRMNNVELYLFVSPVHARQIEVIRVLGLWPLYEQWKRELVAILEQEYAGTHYHFRDYSGYNEITSRDVPTGSMAEYKDSSHYYPIVGDMVLSRLFGSTDKLKQPFGRWLNAGTLDEVLAQIRAEQQQYQNLHPADVREIESLVAELYPEFETVLIERDSRIKGARLELTQ